MNPVTQALLWFLGIVVAAVVAAVMQSARERVRDRVYVRRIKSPKDENATGLIALYDVLFAADATNYSSDELLQYLDTSSAFSLDRHVGVENIVLVAKCKANIVGFVMCHFYASKSKAIISYLGIDQSSLEARRAAAKLLLRKLKKILFDGRHTCRYLFFDLQGVEPNTPRAEASKRRARPRLFSLDAKRLGLNAYTLMFPYMCPKVSVDEEAHEAPFSLVCIPINAKLPNPVPKPLLLEFLDFVYHDCYGDLYEVTDPRHDTHHALLQKRLDSYTLSLPSVIQTACV